MKKLFYVTSPIYYVNDRPHLGTAYTTVIADVLSRYHKLFKHETMFLTGTDEHGQKCLQAAQARKQDPKEHCDKMSLFFKQAWQELGIKYDHFIRTTDSSHKQGVRACLQILWDKKLIYQDTYKGWYSVKEEIFYTEKEAAQTSEELVPIEEKNYFFKMSKYQQALQQHLESHPDFIQPSSRQNEVQGFLKSPLQDLCISRPKSRVSWGVELPFDSEYVAYVWVDALINYLTGISFTEDNQTFKKWWEEAGCLHLIGKDILITHGVYWPCLLMALDLPLPKRILAHGWLLNKDQEKMSKSQGQVINPLKVIQNLSLEALRYFLVRDISLGSDAYISEDMIKKRYNQDLAGNLGNIFSRLTKLISEHYSSKLPEQDPTHPYNKKFQDLGLKTQESVRKSLKELKLHLCVEACQNQLDEINKFLEETKPWKLVKTDKKQAGIVLYVCLESLRQASILLSPIMPSKMQELLLVLGSQANEESLKWGGLTPHQTLQAQKPLFPRF